MISARALAHQALSVHDGARGGLRGALEGRGHQALPADRALARVLSTGVLQRLNTLDWMLAAHSSRPLDSLSPSVRSALRLGAWQLVFAAERFPAYAVLNETVSLAPLAARGFVNAILRQLQRKGSPPWPADPVERLCLEHSYPVWMVKRWLSRGGDVQGFLSAGNGPPPFSLRANRLKVSVPNLIGRLKKEGHEVVPARFAVEGVNAKEFFNLEASPSFVEGLFSVQDEAAQLAAAALDPRPGETVLDLCAGLGGKSGHLAERMGDRGKVIAIDTDAKKISRAQENLGRLGVSIVQFVTADLLSWRGCPADRVLLDAPCSGLGTIRRRPDIKWARREKDVVARLPALQGALLRAAAAWVKPGGVLVYAVCSTEPEENEGVVSDFLGKDPSFSPSPLEGFPAGPDGFLRLRPDLHGTDGFFIARLRRAVV